MSSFAFFPFISLSLLLRCRRLVIRLMPESPISKSYQEGVTDGGGIAADTDIDRKSSRGGVRGG